VPQATLVIEEIVGDIALNKWVVEMRLGKPRLQVDASIEQIDAEMRTGVLELNILGAGTSEQ